MKFKKYNESTLFMLGGGGYRKNFNGPVLVSFLNM